jgi:hypothetical protein
VNELVHRLMERANLSEEQAQKAAGVVADFLREHATGDQLRGLLGNVPGLGQHADKIPDDVGSRAADLLGEFFRKDPE